MVSGRIIQANPSYSETVAAICHYSARVYYQRAPPGIYKTENSRKKPKKPQLNFVLKSCLNIVSDNKVLVNLAALAEPLPLQAAPIASNPFIMYTATVFSTTTQQA